MSLRMRGVGGRGIGSSFFSVMVLLDEGEEVEARVRTTRLATLDAMRTAKGRRSRYYGRREMDKEKCGDERGRAVHEHCEDGGCRYDG